MNEMRLIRITAKLGDAFGAHHHIKTNALPNGLTKRSRWWPLMIACCYCVPLWASDDAASNEDPSNNQETHKPATNADNVWQDPVTGLMWAKCEVGLSINDGHCDGDFTYFTWVDAVTSPAATQGYFGYNDWRMPTIQELSSVYNCLDEDQRVAKFSGANFSSAENANNNGCDPTQYNLPEFVEPLKDIHEAWTITPGNSDSTMLAIATLTTSPTSEQIGNPDGSLPDGIRIATNRVILVRGGSDTAFKKAMNMAKSLQEANSKELKRIEALRQEKNAKDDAHRAAIYAKQGQEYAQKAETFKREKAAYTNKTLALRKSVKPGDKVLDGLVLEVKGDLVRVQTYGNQCVELTVGLNPYTHERDCTRYKRVVTGEQWVSRGELMADK